MNNDNMKNCVNCGRLIPEDSEFCPYCGARQPEMTRLSRDQKNQKPVSNQYQQPADEKPKKTHWYSRWYVWVLIIIIVVLGMLLYKGHEDAENRQAAVESSLSSAASKSPEKVVKEVQEKLVFLGLPSNAISYDQDTGQIHVDVPSDNKAVNGALNNSMIRNQAIKALQGIAPQSNVLVRNQDGKTLLQLNNGKVVSNSFE